MLKYITLWEILMREFEPDQLLFMGAIHAIRSMGDNSSTLSQKEKDDCLHDAECSETLCDTLGLPISKMAIRRIKDLLSRDIVPSGKILKLIDELDNRIIDEMKSRKFFCLEPEKTELLDGKKLFGKEVTSAFPSAIVDIEEAGKCLAFERWTASVTHLMKILELGLDILAQELGIQSENRNWQNIIDQIEAAIREINKTSHGNDWKEKEQFYSEAALYFRFVKNAWRNHVMHLRQVSYDEERAMSIYNYVKEFMNHLAERCHE